MRLFCFFGALLLAWSTFCFADQIVLHNGDVLEGDFKGIVGEEILWKSASFGELKIPKNSVKNIHSERSFKLRGQSTPCAWQSLDHQVATFVCHRGELKRIPILSLEQVVPFDGHQKTNHHYSGNLRVSGIKNQGNVESKYWEVRSRVELRTGDWRHIVQLSSGGQDITLRENGTTVQDRDRRIYGEYKIDWFFSPRYYWSNLLSGEQDTNLNIQEEYRLSSGLGYQFWETTRTAFSMVFGLEHNRTYLMNNPPSYEPESYTSVRLGSDFRYQFKIGLKFYHTNSYSSSLNDPVIPDGEKRWEFRSNTGVNWPIGFGVSADMNLEWNYKNHAKDQDPNAFRKDSVYRVGLNYAW